MDDSQIKIEEELLHYEGEDRVVSSFEMQKTLKESQQPEISVMSNIEGLDRWINGFAGGELIIISGKTGQGKTLLLRTLTWHFGMQNKVCLWLSYEEMPRQFLKGFLELPLFYMPLEMKPGIIWWVEKRILEAKLKYDTRIVMIDHLHFVVDIARMKHPSLEIGTVVRQLKIMAIKHNVIIFLVAHSQKIRAGEEPSIDTVRDSSLIVQDSDMVLVIWRTEEENGACLSVEKCRRTGAFKKVIKLEKRDGFLREIR